MFFIVIICFNWQIDYSDDNGTYDKIYNDLNYFNFKEKEIENFKILLEYYAELKIKLDNKNTILVELLERNLRIIYKVIFWFFN